MSPIQPSTSGRIPQSALSRDRGLTEPTVDHCQMDALVAPWTEGNQSSFRV